MTGGMMFKGTPGPWEASENAYGKVFVHGGETLTSSVGTEYRELIAGGNSHDTLRLSNARLIAAAPELLEVCQMILKADYNCVTTTSQDAFRMPVISAAIAAIAKALGETK